MASDQAQRGENIADYMFQASAAYARSAVRSFTGQEWLFFALHAGAALELLAKAYLASIHPSLVVEGVDGLLYACGVPGHAGAPTSAIRTISPKEAIKRAGRIMPTLLNLTRGELDLVIEARHGAAHLGRFDTATARGAMPLFLLASEELLRGREDERREYWSDVLETVDQHLASDAEDAANEAEKRIRAARVDYQSKKRDQDAQSLEDRVKAIVSAYRISSYDRQLNECPVCQNPALLLGTIDFEWTVEGDSMDPEDWAGAAYPEVTFYPRELRCHVCGLALSGPRQLLVGGVPGDWILPRDQVEPSDFVGEYDEAW
jgi:hypothetical protein